MTSNASSFQVINLKMDGNCNLITVNPIFVLNNTMLQVIIDKKNCTDAIINYIPTNTNNSLVIPKENTSLTMQILNLEIVSESDDKYICTKQLLTNGNHIIPDNKIVCIHVNDQDFTTNIIEYAKQAPEVK